MLIAGEFSGETSTGNVAADNVGGEDSATVVVAIVGVVIVVAGAVIGFGADGLVVVVITGLRTAACVGTGAVVAAGVATFVVTTFGVGVVIGLRFGACAGVVAVVAVFVVVAFGITFIAVGLAAIVVARGIDEGAVAR